MRLRSALLGLCLVLGPTLAMAQTAPVPPPVTEPAPPSAPPAAAPAPEAASPSTQTAPGTAAAAARPTLVPGAGDPADVAEVTLPGKPAAILSGTSTWDDGFANLKKAFRRLEEELARVAIQPAGRPVAVFVETDDMSFHYEAMIPLLGIPESRGPLPAEIKFGKTPEGKALRFVHKAPYEDIDETYETITAYLDAKNIVAKDAFIEEYVTDLTDPSDGNLEVNIFVQPKE